jgi:hypothetical protein
VLAVLCFVVLFVTSVWRVEIPINAELWWGVHVKALDIVSELGTTRREIRSWPENRGVET